MTSRSWLRYYMENTVVLLILNGHQGFYLEGHVENKTSNSSATFLSPQRFPPKSRKYPIRPVICGHVEPPKHLWGRDRFGIHPHFPVRFSTIYTKHIQILNNSGVEQAITRQHCTNAWCAISRCSKRENAKLQLKVYVLLHSQVIIISLIIFH